MQQFTGLDYLKIAISNSYGMDKKTWNQRLAWVAENRDNLKSLQRQAKEPAMFFAAVQALEDAEAGKPSGFPISLDATSSGLQILSALIGCRKSAEMCNVVNRYDENGEPVRADAYALVYQAMQERNPEISGITQAEAKQAVMTSLYTSVKVPENIFGEHIGTFYDTMEAEVPGAWLLNNTFMKLWNPNATSHNWVLPDNFHVQCKVTNLIEEEVEFAGRKYTLTRKIVGTNETGRSLGANATHSIDALINRELIARCQYDASQLYMLATAIQDGGFSDRGLPPSDNTGMVITLWNHYCRTGFLSARILNYLDVSNLHMVDGKTILDLLDSLPKKAFQVLSVHDCWRCLPSYGNDLRQQYRLLLAHLAKSDLLNDLIRQLTGTEVQVTKADPDLWKDILNAEYPLS